MFLLAPKKIDCEWNEYGQWSECSRTCGDGLQTRNRTIKTLAANGGAECTGFSTDYEVCNVMVCPKFGMILTFFEHILKCTFKNSMSFETIFRRDLSLDYTDR